MSESNLARVKGWPPLGVKRVRVKKVLSDSEKLQIGARQSECLIEAQKVEVEKAQTSKRFDTQIKALKSEALDKSKDLKNGYVMEDQDLPCYLDKKARERVYFNDYDEEVHREPMHSGDDQLTLGVA